jgi:hypothetical protein
MNYILRYKGEGKPNALKLRRELLSNNIRIVDNSALPQMAKVALHSDDLAKLRAVTGHEWDMFPEKSYAVPTTRRKIKK